MKVESSLATNFTEKVISLSRISGSPSTLISISGRLTVTLTTSPGLNFSMAWLIETVIFRDVRYALTMCNINSSQEYYIDHRLTLNKSPSFSIREPSTATIISPISMIPLSDRLKPLELRADIVKVRYSVANKIETWIRTRPIKHKTKRITFHM